MNCFPYYNTDRFYSPPFKESQPNGGGEGKGEDRAKVADGWNERENGKVRQKTNNSKNFFEAILKYHAFYAEKWLPINVTSSNPCNGVLRADERKQEKTEPGKDGQKR